MKKRIGVLIGMAAVLLLLAGAFCGAAGAADGSDVTVGNEQELRDAIASGTAGIVKLGDNITLTTGTLEIKRKVTLDLNGKTLSRSNTDGTPDFAVITITTSGNLTMEDSTGGGKVTGGTGAGWPERSFDTIRGGGVLVYGTFNMVGGNITNNKANGRFVSPLTYSCYASGGGVGVMPGATFNMSGGTINNNVAYGISEIYYMEYREGNGYGGGVYVGENGIFNMSGGSITNNTATHRNVGDDYGGGVFVEYGGTFILSGGTPVIKDNSIKEGTNNVWIVGNDSLRLTGELEADADIRITSVSSLYPLLGVFFGLVDTPGRGESHIKSDDEKRWGYSFNGKLMWRGEKDVAYLKKKDGTVIGSYPAVTAAVETIEAGSDDYIITLRDNVDGENIFIDGKKIILDLKGHILKGTGTGSVIYITNGGDLTVSDNSTTPNYHYFTFVDNGPWTLDTTTPQTYVDLVNFDRTAAAAAAKGTYHVRINGGCITGGSAREKGGGVCVAEGTLGTLTQNSGSIVGNSANDGGGVYLGGGTFTMNGGNIVGNSANDHGAGVGCLLKGTIYLSDSASIIGNTASRGGGVSIGMETRNSVMLIMTGGSITGNKANFDGGGVFVSVGDSATRTGGFTMEGGSITNNTAYNDGGGVYFYDIVGGGNPFTLSGGTISDNISKVNGGGVFLHEGVWFTMTGGSITGNRVNNNEHESFGKGNGGGLYISRNDSVEISGGIITENTATNYGGGVFVKKLDYGECKVSGTPVISGNTKSGGAVNNVYLSQGENHLKIVGDGLKNGAAIGVTKVNGTGNVAEEVKQDYSMHFTSDNPSYNIQSSNDTKYVQLVTANPTKYSLIYNGNGNSSGTAPAPQRYNSNVDVTVSGKESLVKKGYSFAGWNTKRDGTGSTYSAGDSITITSNTILYAMWIPSHSVTITFDGNGGTIGGQTTTTEDYFVDEAFSTHFPAVDPRTSYVFDSWWTTADTSGRKVDGSEIVSIDSPTQLYAHWTPGFIRYNGTVYTGIDITGGAGSPFTKDNAEMNGSTLSLKDDVILNGTLEVIAPKDVNFTIDLKGHVLSQANTNAASPVIKVMSDGNLILTDTGTKIEHYFSGTLPGKLTLTSDPSSATETVSGGCITGGSASGVVVEERGTFTLSGGTIVGNTTQKLGHGGGVSNSGTFIMNNGGVIKGNGTSENGYGGGVYVSDACTFTMNGGAISDNRTEQMGGGVYLEENSTITMTGGTISRNCARFDGGGIYSDGGTISVQNDGAEISENRAETGNGGGVYVDKNSALKFTGGKIGQNTASMNGGGVYLNKGTIAMSADAEIDASNELYLGNNTQISVPAAFTPGTSGARNIVLASQEPAGTVLASVASGQDASAALSHFRLNSKYNNQYELKVNGSNIIVSKLGQTYTVTFDVQEHGTAPAHQQVAIGDKVPKPADPVAAGYSFGGWYKEKECINLWNFDTGTVSGDMTLYAKWTANKYTITLNVNGGSGGTASITATYDSPDHEPATITNPTQEGREFIGWYTAASDGDKVIDTNGTYQNVSGYVENGVWKKAEDVTFYAHWIVNTQYTVTFNGNKPAGASGNVSGVPENITDVTSGSTITTPSSAPTLTGHTFGGWYKDAACTNKWNFSGETNPDTVTENTTLYAQWTANTYYVKFNKEDGTGPDMPDQTLTYDAGPTKLSKNTYTAPAGKFFAGWAKSSGGTVEFADEAEVSNLTNQKDGIVNLHAVWSEIPIYTITKGTVTHGTLTVDKAAATESETITVTATPDAGYKVSSLTYTQDGGSTSTISGGSFKMPPANVIVNAVFDLIPTPAPTPEPVTTYTLTYHANGATSGTAPASQTCTKGGAPVTIAGPGSLTKDGYSFLNWNTAADGSGSSYTVGESVPLSESITLYAQWLEIKVIPEEDSEIEVSKDVTSKTAAGEGMDVKLDSFSYQKEVVSEDGVSSVEIGAADNKAAEAVIQIINPETDTVAALFDITPCDEAGAPVSSVPNGITVNLTVTLKPGEKGEDIAILHYNKETGEWETLDAEVIETPPGNGIWTVSVTAYDFSPFAVILTPSYRIVNNEPGIFTVPEYAAPGKTVTIAIEDAEDWFTYSPVVFDASGAEIPVSSSEGQTYIFTMPASDVTVDKELIKRYIVLDEPENGSISARGSGYYGEAITVTAVPDEGYKVKSVAVVTSEAVPVPVVREGDSYVFSMPASDVFVTAEFSKLRKSGGGGGGDEGTSVWATPEPTKVPTAEPTVTPTVEPTKAQTPGATETPAAKSPVPFLGIVAGLGAAAAVFGLRRR